MFLKLYNYNICQVINKNLIIIKNFNLNSNINIIIKRKKRKIDKIKYFSLKNLFIIINIIIYYNIIIINK